MVALACPGTTLAQVGVGYRDAIFTLIGGIFGAVAYSYATPALSKTFLAEGGGKIILSDLVGIPYWQGALILAALLIVVLIVMERMTDWRSELGSDVDGDRPELTAHRGPAGAVPAE